ncbi:MAG: MFS transporter [Candidatus Methanofastidiosia archaeon]
MINSIFLGTMALAWPLFPYVTVKVVNATKFQISLIWASFMVTSFIGQKYGGMLSDVIGRRKSLFIFFLPMSLVAFFYAIAQNWYYLLLGSLFGGLSNGAGFIAANTYVLDCAPETKKASYTGFSNLTIGVASFISSLISGVIAQNLSGAIGLEKTLRVMLFIIFLLRILSATFYLRVEETLDLS